MTLSELADFICTKVNQTEANDLAACKTYLRQRRDMIWQGQLWKDALVEYSVDIDPTAAYAVTSPYLPTKGVLLLPPEIERVLAVRTSTRKLNIIRPEFLYRIDYHAFGTTGEVIDYHLLPPCVWEWDTAQIASLIRGDDADLEAVALADVLSSDGTSVAREVVTLNDTAKALTETERLDAISKPATTGALSLAVWTDYHVVTNNASASFLFTCGSSTVTLAPGESGSLTVGGAMITAREVADGFAPTYAMTISYSAGTPIANGVHVSFSGSVFTVGSSYTTILTIPASSTTATKRQRVRLVEAPGAATTIRVLGKRKAPTFTDNNDESGLSGADNCLIAFVQADMLQRERQYGKAQVLQQEAIALLDQLRHLETVQQAHHVRMMPDSGFGPDCTEYF
jgi:hypothetical protein